MTIKARNRILQLATESGALQYGEFQLSSGKISKYYFDGRLLTLHAEGVSLISDLILRMVLGAGAQAIGGPTLGADPMVGAVLVKSYSEGTPLSGFLVRAQQKEHGTQRLIEGPLEPGLNVAIIDDTCTSGRSLMRAIQLVETKGCTVVLVAVVLDRDEGGKQQITQAGYLFRSLLTADNEGSIKVTLPVPA